jgi:hypothetical protein
MTNEQLAHLEKTKKISEKATQLLAELNSLLETARKEFPISIYAKPSDKKKFKTPKGVFEILTDRSNLYKRTLSAFETQERMKLEAEEKRKHEEQQKKLEVEKQLQKSQKLVRAIKFLIDRGVDISHLGSDMIIDTANDIAFDEEVVAREKEIGDGYIDFYGQNCDDPCDGWNPSDYRCQCGNRRVSWEESYGSDFENMEIHAGAH